MLTNIFVSGTRVCSRFFAEILRSAVNKFDEKLDSGCKESAVPASYGVVTADICVDPPQKERRACITSKRI